MICYNLSQRKEGSMSRPTSIQTFLAAIAALTILSGGAERTSNSFFTIEGEGVRIADDGSVCVDAGASGPVRITARSGWAVTNATAHIDPAPASCPRVESRVKGTPKEGSS